MRVTLLCNNPEHPVMPYLRRWVSRNDRLHDVELIESIKDASGGDMLFLISCSEKILKEDRDSYRRTLVLHASDLPFGRGWSPHVWDIIEGANQLFLTLLDAEDVIDSGRIWKKEKIDIPKHYLWNEINDALFSAEMELLDFAIASLDSIEPQDQDESIVPTYRRKRSPEDSRISPERTIAEQFDLLRMCDPERFPAFFDHLGHRYTLKLEKADE